MSPQDTIRKFTEGAARVKLPGGIFGKTCYVLMSIAGALAVIVAAVRTEGIAYVAVGALTIITLITFRQMFQFAKANPQVAIMEGAEYIAYQQIQFAQKGTPALPSSPAEAPDAADLSLPMGSPALLKCPDTPGEESNRPKRRRTNG